jgi:hypothetical protein
LRVAADAVVLLEDRDALPARASASSGREAAGAEPTTMTS